MKRPRGVALATALLAILSLSVLSWLILNFSQISLVTCKRLSNQVRAYHGAEGAVRLYLSQPELWNKARTQSIELEGCQVTLRVVPGKSSIHVDASALAGITRSTILLEVSPNGYLLSRQEL